ncbi:MAG: putative ABC transporter permease [Lachnospiraceae bacterium]
MTFYQLVWNFLIYSVVGWCVEVIFHALTFHRVINRGFLNGPVCPVYGFGVVVVFGVLNTVTGLLGGRSFGEAIIKGGTGLPPGKDINIFLLYVIGVVFCTIVELLGGILLDVVYHTRWWDYTDEFLNYKGYICLKFSLLWGLGIVIVVKLVQPLFLGKATELIPESIGWWIAGFFLLIYVVDLIVSALTMFQVNKTLKELDAVRSGMRAVSSRVSYFLGETAFIAEEFSGRQKAQEMAEEDMNLLETREEFEATHAKELAKAVEMREQFDKSWFGRGTKTVGEFLKKTGDSAAKAAKSATDAIASTAKGAATAISDGAKSVMQVFKGNPEDIKALAAEAEALEARGQAISKKLDKHSAFLKRISRAGGAIKSTRYQESMEVLQRHINEHDQ